MMKPRTIIGVLIFFLFLVAVWGFLIEPNSIKTESVTIQVENTYGFLKELKMLQISDLHIKEFGQKEEKTLVMIKKESPDFIFITGDMVDWTTKDFSGIEKFLGELSLAFPGKVFAIYGNHEHKNPKFKTLQNILAQTNIQILDNEYRKIQVGKNFFYVIGVDDPHLGYDNLDKATAGLEKDAFKILLAHSPEIFRKAAGRVNLVLAGHTHGCQVNLPFVCDLILPLNYDKKYKSGLFEENSTYLYVNRGIGETVVPFRLFAPPEITVFNFIEK